MLCTKCGTQTDQSERFCRKCGADLKTPSLALAERGAVQTTSSDKFLRLAVEKDPDELIGTGLASLFMGDGFFVVGVLLSVVESSVTSLLWLLLLIPAFFFFGKGVADVFRAQQIRKRTKKLELAAAPVAPELLSPRSPVAEIFMSPPTGDAFPAASVTDRTTRQLK